MRKSALIVLPLAACGMKVNINGKTHTLGGSQETTQTAASQPPQQQQQQQQQTGSQQPGAPATVAAAFKTATIAVTAPLTTTPLLADVDGVSLEASFRKTIGADSPDCGSQTSPAPIAVIDLKQPAPNMHINVNGARNDGFIVRRGDLFWTMCTDTIGEVPGMGPPKEGWQPGRYEVFPVTRYSGKGEVAKLEVSVFDPKNAAPWSEKVQRITVEHKLEQPMIIEVPVRADRQVRREGLSGYGCQKTAFAFEPDIALKIARPIPGLVVRPLPTQSPVTLRVEHGDKQRHCPEGELGFNREEEGEFAISVGLPPGATETKIKLMITDQSTKLDPMFRNELPGPLDLAHRALPWHFPQLDLKEVDLANYAHAELAAKLFAAAPQGAFVYPDIDLDGDVATVHHPANDKAFPKKNEPLLVLQTGEHVRVLAQDGLQFSIKASHVALEPQGAAAPLAGPRKLDAKLDLGQVEQLLPPSDKALIASLDAANKQHEDRVDRVADPYEKQLPTIVHPAGVDVVYVETPHTRAIRDAEDAAIIRKCGSREAYDKRVEATRVKMLAEVEKVRAKLFATSKRP